MIKSAVIAAALLSAVATSGAAQAAGCVKGAMVGGVAGHYAGHHGLLGAGIGCLIGRHEANRRNREQDQRHGGYDGRWR
jgi:hypothetical protein